MKMWPLLLSTQFITESLVDIPNSPELELISAAHKSIEIKWEITGSKSLSGKTSLSPHFTFLPPSVYNFNLHLEGLRVARVKVESVSLKRTDECIWISFEREQECEHDDSLVRVVVDCTRVDQVWSFSSSTVTCGVCCVCVWAAVVVTAVFFPQLCLHPSLSLSTGFTIFVREESGSWREIPVSAESRMYQLRDLLCGTKYQIYVTAHNEAGTGLPSNTVATRTHGTGQRLFLAFALVSRPERSFCESV